MTWSIEHHRGSARAFHERVVPSPATRAVWVHEVDRGAVVLGSAQRDDVLDPAAVASADVEVVRRRSGGGAVLLLPGSVVWVDVVIGRDDRLWDDDVGRAMWWLGDRFARAVGGTASVHHGPMVTTRWSRLVCFAGLGPGEVTVEGRKVVGISQRRTRDAARFQCALYRRWDIGALAELLRLEPAQRRELTDDLADAVATSTILEDDIVAAIVE
jgi:lipoate-protein ligase A